MANLDNNQLNANGLAGLLLAGGPEALKELARQAVDMEKVARETGVTWEGTKIILPAVPEKLSLQAAKTIIEMHEKAASQEYDFSERVDGYPFDAAAAFYRAVMQRYGFVNSVTVQKHDFWGRPFDCRPDMRQIRTGPKPTDLIQIPVGAFQLPGFERPIESEFYIDKRTKKLSLRVFGRLKAKDRDVLLEILAETRRELKENSIYKNRALILRTNDEGEVTLDNEPEFMATDKIDPSQLVLSRNIEEDIQVNLLTPILRTKECVKAGIPLKRAVILAGPYGTGKTLCAYSVAKHCVDSGEWTYIMVDNPAGLPGALQFARNYEPAVVFAEDVDRVAENRDEDTNKLMDMADGALAKDSKVMMVLTTNHIENIHPAVLRPGRTDAIIYVEAPDGEAAQRLVRLNAGKLLDPKEDLTALGEEIANHIPAVIAEVTKRAKLSMVNRGAKSLNQEDLLIAARSIKTHAAMAKDKKAVAHNAHERLGMTFEEIMANGPMKVVHQKLTEIQEYLD